MMHDPTTLKVITREAWLIKWYPDFTFNASESHKGQYLTVEDGYRWKPSFSIFCFSFTVEVINVHRRVVYIFIIIKKKKPIF